MKPKGELRLVTFEEYLARCPELPELPQARVCNGKIICDFCGRLAESVHLIPRGVLDLRSPDAWEVEAACEDHDPGGYWFYIDKDGVGNTLTDEPFDWLVHLSCKTDARLLAFLRWLGYEGARALDGIIKSHRKKARPG